MVILIRWLWVLVYGLIVAQPCYSGKIGQLERVLSAARLDRSTTSGITWEMVEAAADEWEHLQESARIMIQQVRSQILVVHTAVIPFQKKSVNINDVEGRVIFLDRIYKAYKLFWPFYVEDKTVGHPVMYAESEKSDLIFQVAIGLKERDLTMDDFASGKEEITRMYIRRDMIIGDGDAYDKSEELKMIFNSITLPYIKVLHNLSSDLKRDPQYALYFYREILREKKLLVPVKGFLPRPNDQAILQLMCALEVIYKHRRRDLSISNDLIQKAVVEYRQLDVSSKDLLDLDPRLKMVVDFAIIPAIKNKVGDPSSLKELVNQYRLFRPGYVQRRIIGNSSFPSRSGKFKDLIRLAQRQDDRVPTVDEFRKAKSDLDEVIKLLYDYGREGNIYENLDGLKNALNFYNSEPARIFVKTTYNKIHSEMNAVETFENFRQELAKPEVQERAWIQPRFSITGIRGL